MASDEQVSDLARRAGARDLEAARLLLVELERDAATSAGSSEHAAGQITGLLRGYLDSIKASPTTGSAASVTVMTSQSTVEWEPLLDRLRAYHPGDTFCVLREIDVCRQPQASDPMSLVVRLEGIAAKPRPHQDPEWARRINHMRSGLYDNRRPGDPFGSDGDEGRRSALSDLSIAAAAWAGAGATAGRGRRRRDDDDDDEGGHGWSPGGSDLEDVVQNTVRFERAKLGVGNALGRFFAETGARVVVPWTGLDSNPGQARRARILAKAFPHAAINHLVLVDGSAASHVVSEELRGVATFLSA